MAIILTLNKQEQFTGEFPVTPQTGAMWRFNEATPMVADDVNYVLDSSGRITRQFPRLIEVSTPDP